MPQRVAHAIAAIEANARHATPATLPQRWYRRLVAVAGGVAAFGLARAGLMAHGSFRIRIALTQGLTVSFAIGTDECSSSTSNTPLILAGTVNRAGAPGPTVLAMS